MAAPKLESRDLHFRLPVISGPSRYNGIGDEEITVR